MAGLNDDHQHGAQESYEGADDGHQHGAQGAASRGGKAYQRIEVITGEARRRRWSREEKARITALSFEPDCNVAALAREHGVSIGLLHYWRRVARERMSESEMRFVPLMTSAPAGSAVESADGVIEIVLFGTSIRITGAVDRVALETVLAAVRASA